MTTTNHTIDQQDRDPCRRALQQIVRNYRDAWPSWTDMGKAYYEAVVIAKTAIAKANGPPPHENESQLAAEPHDGVDHDSRHL